MNILPILTTCVQASKSQRTSSTRQQWMSRASILLTDVNHVFSGASFKHYLQRPPWRALFVCSLRFWVSWLGSQLGWRIHPCIASSPSEWGRFSCNKILAILVCKCRPFITFRAEWLDPLRESSHDKGRIIAIRTHRGHTRTKKRYCIYDSGEWRRDGSKSRIKQYLHKPGSFDGKKESFGNAFRTQPNWVVRRIMRFNSWGKSFWIPTYVWDAYAILLMG